MYSVKIPWEEYHNWNGLTEFLSPGIILDAYPDDIVSAEYVDILSFVIEFTFVSDDHYNWFLLKVM